MHPNSEPGKCWRILNASSIASKALPDLLYWEGNRQRKTCKWQRWCNLKQNNPLSDIRNSHYGGSDSLCLQLGNFLIIWSLLYFLPSNILKSHEKWTLIYWFPHLKIVITKPPLYTKQLKQAELQMLPLFSQPKHSYQTAPVQVPVSQQCYK